jgi:hypothetical protein
MFRPEDELRGVRLDVRLAEPQKVRAHGVVEDWNRAVKQAVDAEAPAKS